MIAIPCPGLPGQHGSAQTTYRFVLVSGGTARPTDGRQTDTADNGAGVSTNAGSPER